MVERFRRAAVLATKSTVNSSVGPANGRTVPVIVAPNSFAGGPEQYADAFYRYASSANATSFGLDREIESKMRHGLPFVRWR